MPESNHNPQLSTLNSQLVIGESDLQGFTEWWESNLPSWLVLYCIKGEARLSLGYKSHIFKQGMATIIAPDFYPAITSATDDFMVFYVLANRDFVNKSLFGIPKNFYDAIYLQPILKKAHFATKWKEMFESFYKDSGNAYYNAILSDLFRSFILDYYDKWERQYNKLNDEDKRSPTEEICNKFYDLVFDHYREERSIAFYAKELCITPSYLAVVIKQIGGESPKAAINRQVTMDIIYMLRNTNMNNKEIADYMHFPDTSYMCRYFRRQTGYSPSEYRSLQVSLPK